jgi:hypothetical protein
VIERTPLASDVPLRKGRATGSHDQSEDEASASQGVTLWR